MDLSSIAKGFGGIQCVAGSLKNNVEFWEQLLSNVVVMEGGVVAMESGVVVT